jgi:dienelactone hydrolase
MPVARDLVIAAALASLAIPSPAAAQLGIDTVRMDGLVAHLHRPSGAGRAPAVILIGGSGGGIGWQDYMANLLAQRGFSALALGYFGMEGLPKELERIPIERFERAIRWLAAQPTVDSTRIGVGGVSKGGELALLLGSMFPQIRAVAAFVPSGFVHQSIAEGYPRTSSWTFQGRELPYVPYGSVPGATSTAELYLAGVKSLTGAALEEATIKVERINGPILMLSGKSDNLFGSATLAGLAEARLRAKGFGHPFEHIAYENAGHLISSIRSEDVTRRGGTAEGNTFAQRDGQRRFLEFFDRVFLPMRR